LRIDAIGLVLAGAALFPACGGANAAIEATTPAPESAPIGIRTAAAVERDVPTVIRVTGSFVADESSDVTPQVPGQIIATLVNVGDIVQAGQVLVRLDDRDARLKVRQAEASLLQAEAQARRAQAEAKRNVELVESGDISRSSYEQLTTQVAVAEAAVAQAAAQVASAQKGVDDAVIVAPFSGHISARPVAVGEYVATSAKVATVVRITPIKLQMLVPESAAATLRKGMSVTASVPAHPGRTFAGTVSALNVAIDPSSRAMAIEAAFPNRDAALTPGMFGSAEVRLPATERVLFVPEAAVVPLPNGESFAVYVVEGDVVRVRVVQPDVREGGMVRVLSGLEPGVPVAASNVKQLFEGARVRVEAATASSELAPARGRQGE
jgi:membrane fusion protein (multidrug efflux system)